MDAKALEALKDSIAAWERKLAEDDPGKIQMGVDACALCQLFFHYDDCLGCPVSEKTGESGCGSSPYGAARLARYDWRHRDGTREAFQKAAQAEIDFLKLLLPVED